MRRFIPTFFSLFATLAVASAPALAEAEVGAASSGSRSVYGGVGVPSFKEGLGLRGTLGYRGTGPRWSGHVEGGLNSLSGGGGAIRRSRFDSGIRWSGRARGAWHPVARALLQYDSFTALGGSAFEASAQSRIGVEGGARGDVGAWALQATLGLGRIVQLSMGDGIDGGLNLRTTAALVAERPVLSGWGELRNELRVGTYRSLSISGDDARGAELSGLVNVYAAGLSGRIVPGAFVSVDAYTQPSLWSATGGVSFRGRR